MGTPRRTFLVGGLSAVAIGSGTYAWLRARGYAEDPSRLSPGPGRDPVADLPGAPYPPRARETLPPLVDVLLPGDPDIALPSGTEAGVVEFLIAASRLPELRPVRADILKLTRHLDIGAQGLRGIRFVQLEAPEDRVEIVRATADDPEPRGRFVPAHALEATLRLCLEGYLGHPHHGGNRDAQVWDALSIRMPRDRTPAHLHHG